MKAVWVFWVAQYSYEWHSDLAQSWWIGVRQSVPQGIPVAQFTYKQAMMALQEMAVLNGFMLLHGVKQFS